MTGALGLPELMSALARTSIGIVPSNAPLLGCEFRSRVANEHDNGMNLPAQINR